MSVSHVLEHGRGDGKRDNDGTDLCRIDESDCVWHTVRGNLCWSYRVGGLLGQAGADGHENRVSVDCGVGGGRCYSGVHNCTADCDEDGGDEKERHVVADFWHQCAIKHRTEDSDDNEREEAHGRFHATVATGELEEDRNI